MRKIIFKIIGISLPFLFLFLLEGGLRLFHYGHDTSLFIEDSGNKDYYVLNPDASRKYFINQANATTGNLEPFRKVKDPNTLRIFVLGESTTIGYPYFHNGSFHRWLQYRLLQMYPERDFEIINLSLTAVNSYTVLGFTRELVDFSPDAVLIYTGHNEYYGALGVGSTDRIGGNAFIVNLMLALRKQRTIQWLTNVYERIRTSFSSKASTAGKTRMEMMVAEQLIPYGSKLYDRGIDQFRLNINETLRILDQHTIPVFISSLVANEKDMPPFISNPVDSAAHPVFIKNYDQGRQAFEAGDGSRADSFFRTADHDYNAHALCNFYLGRLAFLRGDSLQAAIRFGRAKELDALRFRAPDSINKIIPELCARYRSAHFVDARTAFQAASPGHLIGKELLLEHIHPNLDGYALLSDLFYQAMRQQGFFLYGQTTEMTDGQLRRAMPITAMDSLTGVYKIKKLENSWPFLNKLYKDPSGTPTAAALPHTREGWLADGIAFGHIRWQDAMDSLYNEYAGMKDWIKAAGLLENLALEYPLEEPYCEKAANLFGESKDYDKALLYFRRSFHLSPSFEKARNIFVLYFKLDRPAAAIPYLDYAMHNNTSGFNLAPVRQIAAEIIRLQEASRGKAADPAVLRAIAGNYRKMGNQDGAVKYNDSALHWHHSEKSF